MDRPRGVSRAVDERATGSGVEGRDPARPGTTKDGTGMDVGMLILRLVVGLTMSAHGAQKLFGWFGGPGFAGTARFLEQMGFRPGELHSALSGGAELGGGLLLALGLLTPLGAAAVTGAMVAAIATVTWQNGFISAKGGWEYSLVLIASALAITFVGPGRFSLDRALGWALWGKRWGVGAAALAVVTAAGVVSLRHQPVPVHAAPQGPGAISDRIGFARSDLLEREGVAVGVLEPRDLAVARVVDPLLVGLDRRVVLLEGHAVGAQLVDHPIEVVDVPTRHGRGRLPGV